MINKLVCLLLAGGKSERFWPLTDKNLMPMMGKPLIQRQIENLVKLGFKDIIVVGNEAVFRSKSEGFHDPGSNNSRLSNNHNNNLFFVRQQTDKASGMAGAILSAYELYQNNYKGRPIYILNANDFYENSFHQQMLKTIQRQEGDVFIAAYQVDKYLPMGYLTVKAGRITSIVEKPAKGNEPSDLVNFVAHFYREPEELFQALVKGSDPGKGQTRKDDLYEQAMARLMKRRRFVPVIYRGEWQPLKYPWHLLDVMKYFLSHIKDTPLFKERSILYMAGVSPKATVTGPVVLEKGVRVMDNTKIVGPAYIGSNTIIGDQALVRESVVGANCIVGFGSEVARSYLGDHCLLHHNYIGDSVLDKDVNMGFGAVTANWRFDEHNIFSVIKGRRTDTDRTKLGTIIGQGTKIGVNASIMPGVKIGRNTLVMPGTVASKDIAG